MGVFLWARYPCIEKGRLSETAENSNFVSRTTYSRGDVVPLDTYRARYPEPCPHAKVRYNCFIEKGQLSETKDNSNLLGYSRDDVMSLDTYRARYPEPCPHAKVRDNCVIEMGQLSETAENSNPVARTGVPRS